MTNSANGQNNLFPNFTLTGEPSNFIPDKNEVEKPKIQAVNPFSNFEISFQKEQKNNSLDDEHLTIDDLDIDLSSHTKEEVLDTEDEHITLDDLDIKPKLEEKTLETSDDRLHLDDLDIEVEVKDSTLELSEEDHLTIDDLDNDIQIESTELDESQDEIDNEGLFLEDIESDIQIQNESNNNEDIQNNEDQVDPLIDEGIDDRLYLDDLEIQEDLVESNDFSSEEEDGRLSIDDLDTQIEVDDLEITEAIDDDLENFNDIIEESVEENIEDDIEIDAVDIDLAIDDDLDKQNVIISYPLDMDQIDLEIDVNDLKDDKELIVLQDQYLYSNNSAFETKSNDELKNADEEKTSLKDELHKAVNEDPLNSNFFSYIDDGNQEEINEPSPVATKTATLEHDKMKNDSIALESEDEEDLKEVLIYLDQLFGHLPENVIKDFAQSPYYDKYTSILDKLEL